MKIFVSRWIKCAIFKWIKPRQLKFNLKCQWQLRYVQPKDILHLGSHFLYRGALDHLRSALKVDRIQKENSESGSSASADSIQSSAAPRSNIVWMGRTI